MADINPEKIRARVIQEAQELVSSHWQWHREFNEDRVPRDKARLNLNLREKGTSIELFWTRFKFIRKPGHAKSTISSTYISKGKWDKYPDGRLTRYAMEDEIETILEFEAKAAVIRKAIRYINDIRTAHRKLEKMGYGQEAENE